MAWLACQEAFLVTIQPPDKLVSLDWTGLADIATFNLDHIA